MQFAACLFIPTLGIQPRDAHMDNVRKLHCKAFACIQNHLVHGLTRKFLVALLMLPDDIRFLNCLVRLLIQLRNPLHRTRITKSGARLRLCRVGILLVILLFQQAFQALVLLFEFVYPFCHLRYPFQIHLSTLLSCANQRP